MALGISLSRNGGHWTSGRLPCPSRCPGRLHPVGDGSRVRFCVHPHQPGVAPEPAFLANRQLLGALHGSRDGVRQGALTGEEASLFVVTDGERWLCLPAAQDHKRLRDGDQGPNTGGMGAYCPAPVCSPAVLKQVEQEVVAPTLAGLRAEGRPFVGALFVGLMIDAGRARVIEYNCRFGDPEIQPVLFGLQAPIVPALYAAASGRLRPPAVPLAAAAAASVVIAAAGYPERVAPGAAIRGLEAASALSDVKVFHAGTRRGPGGWVTAGGRVLGVCARGPDLRAAIERAYAACAHIEVVGGQYRRDIGGRAPG